MLGKWVPDWKEWVWPACDQYMFAKMLSANHIAGFFNQLYLLNNKKNELAWFLTCQYKYIKIKSSFKNLWVVMVKNRCDHRLRDPNIDFITRMNRRNKLIFWTCLCFCLTLVSMDLILSHSSLSYGLQYLKRTHNK